MNFEKGIDYVGIFLFEHTPTPVEDPPRRERRRQSEPVDPTHLIPNENPYDGLAEAPPPISGYRDANVQGMACWNCAHFTAVNDADNDGIVDGICNLFEAKAEGECTCDRFTAHADLFRQSPHTSWQEDMANQGDSYGPGVMEGGFADNSSLARLNFTGTATEEDGLVWKDILRTGRWTKTPTGRGVIKKPLEIVRDGESDPEGGIISLSEIQRHFEEGAVPYVTVPLSDEERDHKNIARLNTGFVRKLQLVDRDGVSVLRAGIDFTEPDVKGKVLRGTIPDVSAGVPFYVTRRSDDRVFKTVLDHVCLTRKPFVDKLLPFGVAAADGDELPVDAFEPETERSSDQPSPAAPEGAPSPPPSEGLSLTFRQYQEAIRRALTEQLRLSPDYLVDDVAQDKAIIFHRISGTRWEVPFRISGEREVPLILAGVENWKMIESEEEAPALAASNSPKLDELKRARELRELRLSQPTSQAGGIQMSALSLDGIELSNLPEEARVRIQSVLDENQRLSRTNRENQVNERIEELQGIPGLNLADRPGALKLYRQIMLSDDGGPAIVLFSDEEDESKKERLTALQILDRFIDGLKAGSDVQFSDQHFASGNDTKPPLNAKGEARPLDERVKDAQTALYGKRNRRK